jgi:hypothetical protein
MHAAGPGCGLICTARSGRGPHSRYTGRAQSAAKEKKKKERERGAAGPAPSQPKSPELGRKRPWAKLVCCGLIKHSKFFFSFSFFIFQKHLNNYFAQLLNSI